MIFVIMGPTGVGKTLLSIALAKKYHGEIINADSMQVYKGLDIGTAKIKEEEKEGIIHHLFDICEINDLYTVYDYQKDARKKIKDIMKKGKNVILVGGTGLYIKAALFDYQFSKEEKKDNYDHLTNEEIYHKIQTFHIEDIPHVHNRKRLIRLLNKLENDSNISKNGNQLLYQNVFFFYLKAPRELLYPRLDARVEEMFQKGLVEEVTRYQDFFQTSKALQTGIGYKEFLPYFRGEKTLDDVKTDIQKNTRHYAKRQDTFFRHQFVCHEINVNFQNFQKTIDEVCEFISMKQ